MRSGATRRFWRRYAELPTEIQRLADKAYTQWRDNPHHPALDFKELQGAKGRFSVRVGAHYRAIARLSGGGVEWVWIGTHEEYNRLLRSRQRRDEQQAKTESLGRADAVSKRVPESCGLGQAKGALEVHARAVGEARLLFYVEVAPPDRDSAEGVLLESKAGHVGLAALGLEQTIQRWSGRPSNAS